MLTELHIEDLGIIERTTLQFGPGFTVFTGETGAGKTMLVEAIGLVVGGRADASMVRAGAAEARVEGRFVVGAGADAIETILSRVISAEGGSRAYIDGRPATVAALAEAAASLVDIHGQHGHQRLLRPGMQRACLDRFGGIDLGPMVRARAECSRIEEQLAAHGGDERERQREMDLLRHQVSEIERAGITDDDEDATLAREEELLSDVVATREAAAGATAALTRESGPSDQIRAALGLLGTREVFAALRERLKAIVIDLDDAAEELRSAADDMEEKPERLAWLRERRQLLRDLRRKYGDDLAGVRRFAEQAAERLASLERWTDTVAELTEALVGARARLEDAEAEVGRQRRECAPRLASAVQSRLADLGMGSAILQVDVGPDRAGDEVVFMLAANPGSAPLPLAKVASGGELSRSMLALRLVLADDPAAMIFDEVDAGLGGGAGVTVGRALSEVARNHQVFAVTHLAQVAAAADTQILVAKTSDGRSTTGTAKVLAGSERVEEIARMLSGGVAEQEARGHAQRLLQEFGS